MKRRIRFIVGMMLLVVNVLPGFVLTCTAQKNKADVKFARTTINMGKFSKEKPVRTASVSFCNTGTEPLVIYQANASCGCVVVDFPRNPIKPGEKASVKIHYDGKGKILGMFNKSIRIVSSADRDVILKTKGSYATPHFSSPKLRI